MPTADVQIVEFEPQFAEAFQRLNEEWIVKYFEMEEADRKALGRPQEYILDRGGFIFVALLDGEPAGVCALIKRDDLYAYELAKMAVSPRAMGQGIGAMLGRAAIAKAAAVGATRLYLESNTKLVPAIRLHEKLGFTRVEGIATPYQRCDIQMELVL